MNDYPSYPSGLKQKVEAVQNAQSGIVNGSYSGLIRTAANKYGLPESVLTRLLAQESGNFDPDVISGRRRGGAGELGIAQFLPSTLQWLQTNPEYGKFDPLNPAQAIDAAAHYLADQTAIFNGDLEKGVAAYNAGAGNVQLAIQRAGRGDWRQGLPETTKNIYLPKVYGSPDSQVNTQSWRGDRPPELTDFLNPDGTPDPYGYGDAIKSYYEGLNLKRQYELGPESQFIDDVIKELKLEIEAGNLNVRKASEVLNTRIQGYKTAVDFYSSDAFKYGAPPGATHIPAGQYGSSVLGRQPSAIQGGVTINPMQEALNVYREAQSTIGGVQTPSVPDISGMRRNMYNPPAAPNVSGAVSSIGSFIGGAAPPRNLTPAQQALEEMRRRMQPALGFRG